MCTMIRSTEPQQLQHSCNEWMCKGRHSKIVNQPRILLCFAGG